ncbi:diguanylate cyclase [Bordetella sp. N]|uniref:GGDEF domain-containing protein n=1 Tax=Bordetella sp. N TaxID=1746199 RepID=UPI00070BDB49|nr:sensor domain-containing diguanylate cyclase [Bordetella sp. N]ALM86077.1 diguanylate cyclase [Bordetella sp. N]
MKAPAAPENEAIRLRHLRALRVLDTLPEERFDRLTRLAKRMFGVPIALVSLVDANRQWFKSRQGLDATETPRDVSFCGHAILADKIFEIPDARADERFADNPLVTGNPGIRFYAGLPLSVGDDMRVGTLCLIDVKPRELSEEDQTLLQDLAHMVEEELLSLHTATMDSLTGLSNRRGFEILSRMVMESCQRLRQPVTLLMFDIDKFKEINDTHGHAEGDQALATFGDVLRRALRDTDVLARLGGDEFVALLSNAGNDETTVILDRLQQELTKENERGGRAYALHSSVGRATAAAGDATSVESLLKVADAAMYENKRSRRAQRPSRNDSDDWNWL